MPGQTERGRTTAMEELLEGLNEKQREAVTSTEGYIRVVAGAGSGKTRALSHRFAYLVNVIGVPPHNILCVTFTNRAANEMRQRIRTLIHDSDTGYISTFHSFCVSVLQEDSYAVQYPDSFLVLDNAEQPQIAIDMGVDPNNVMEFDFADMMANTAQYKEDVMNALGGGDDRFKTE